MRAAGIEFEVIPGVTAALGAAASVQISLTDRRHASRVVFVTAHREGGTGLRNERHVAADTTYVIYMPGHRYAELAAELRAAGIGAEIPCAVISRATTKDRNNFAAQRWRGWRNAHRQYRHRCWSSELSRACRPRSRRPIPTARRFRNGVTKKFCSLALQHPYHDLHGRRGVE